MRSRRPRSDRLLPIVVRYFLGEANLISLELNQAVDAEHSGEEHVLPAWLTAVRAAESKKASNVKVLDLREVTSFTNYFVICTGSNPRQIQAIADEAMHRLKRLGEHAIDTEGYAIAEWILLDYGDFIIHVFSKKARDYYDLERLWRRAKIVEIPAPVLL